MNHKIITALFIITICVAAACKPNTSSQNPIGATNDSIVSVRVNDSVITYNKYFTITRTASEEMATGFPDIDIPRHKDDTIASMIGGSILDTLSLKGQLSLSKQWLGISFPFKEWQKESGLQYFTTIKYTVDGYGDSLTMLASKDKVKESTDFELAFRNKKKEDYTYIPLKDVTDNTLRLSLNKKVQTAIDDKQIKFSQQTKDTLLLVSVQEVSLGEKLVYALKYTSLRTSKSDDISPDEGEALHEQVMTIIDDNKVYAFYSGVDIFLDFFKLQKSYYAFYRFRTTTFYRNQLYMVQKDRWQQVMNAGGEF